MLHTTLPWQGRIREEYTTAASLYALNAAFTGELNYQGGERKTFYDRYPFEPGVTFDSAGVWMTTDHVGPLVAGRDEHQQPDRVAPPRAPAELRRSFVLNLGYFWIGRFGGALAYFPGLVAAALLFLLWGPRERDGWLALVALAAAWIGTILLIPDNWYGGGGTLGNRYLLGFLPLLLLLPRGRALWAAGFADLLMAIIAEPELVRGLVELSVTINLELAKEVAARGVKIVYTGDDYAYNRASLMSPKHFREFFYPGLCRVMQGFKELDLYVIKHTDGNIWPIMDMIIDSGIDCLHPIDPLGGMVLGEVKARYGHRVALKGNVDCTQILAFGSTDEVIEATKIALSVGMPGGGFILSSSNSIHSSVKPENYAAMVRPCMNMAAIRRTAISWSGDRPVKNISGD